MIVPMKKVAVIVRSVDAEETVKGLRKLGLLHVEHQRAPQGKDISTLQDELNLVNSCLEVLSKKELIKASDSQQQKLSTDWRIPARHLIDLTKRYEQLELFSQKIKANISEWEKWGDFEPQKIRELAEKGIFAYFYEVPIKKISEFPKETVVKIISASGGIAKVIVFSQKEFEVSFKKIPLPEQSLSRL